MNNISSISSLLSSVTGTSSSVSGKNSSVSSLFNSLGTSEQGMDSSIINGVSLSDYSSIKSGSYYKLLKKYYSKNTKSATTSEVNTYATKLQSAANGAAGVVSSVNDLKRASFAEGDREKSTEKITDFVSDYNTMISSATNTDQKSLVQKTKWLTNMTKEYSDVLSEIGIDVGSDNRLSIDKDKLSKANEASLKDIFSDTNSFASKVLYKAEQLYSLSMTGGSSATAYTSKANYQPSGISSFNTTT